MTFDRTLVSWQRHLRARNLAPKTLATYTAAARAFARWLEEETTVTSYTDVAQADIEGWVGGLLDRGSPSYASNQYRALQQLFRWLADEGEIDVSPMARMSPPKIPETLVPVLTADQLRALLRTAAGKDFLSRRDTAIMRLFLATGVRLAEMAGLTLPDVDLDERVAVVTGKGRRSRLVRFDAETARALDRYERLRAQQARAELSAYWLSEKGRGRLSGNGIYQMIRRRAASVGIDLHPHVFRHTFSHRFLSAGGAEGDLMELAGWRSAQMLRRYGASARSERARTSYDRLGLMDDL